MDRLRSFENIGVLYHAYWCRYEEVFYESIKRLYYKDPIPNGLKYFLVYKFTCAGCSSKYISETCHFKTGIEKHIKKGSKSHVFQHLHFTDTYFDS